MAALLIPAPMLFGALGDIHGDFAALERVMAWHPEVSFWLSVGDVGSDDGRYPAPAAPLYWIKGNNEDFEWIAEQVISASSGGSRQARQISNLHYLPNAVPRQMATVTVVGLGGTFAPKWYDTRAAELPGVRSKIRDDKRRHFVRDEVDACKRLRNIDVFLTHEAPRPFLVARAGGPKLDAGKTPINEVLSAMRPRLHLFGHHHRFSEAVRQGVRSVGLDVVSQSYLLIDRETLEYEMKKC